MKKLMTIGMVACLMMGCTGKKDATGDENQGCKIVTGYDNEELANGEGLKASVARTVKLETTDDNLISMLNKVVIACDSIIVLTDGSVVQSYGMDGHYRCQYGSKGQGGEEYITLSGFFVNDDNEVVLVDSYRSCMLRYSIDGDFIGKTDVEQPTLKLVNNAMQIDESSLLLCNGISNESNPLYANYNFSDGKAAPILSSPLRTNGIRVHVGKNPISRSKGQIHMLMPFSQYIYDQAGNQVYKIETEKHVLDQEELAAITNYDMMAIVEQKMKGNFCGFSDIFETPTHIICCFSNLSYTVIDKSSLSCQRYGYAASSDLPGDNITPLVNLVGSHGDYVIGNLTLNTLLAPQELTEYLMKRWNCETDDDANPVIVFYKIG